MTEGVDYAWSRPDPAGLYAAGKRFASRYLSYDRTGKNLTLAEAEQLAAAGIAVVANWEWQTGDATVGYDVGRRYAQEAVRQAAACGMPAGRPIYFSVDYDPAGAYGSVDAYFEGVASVLPVDQIGAYGGYATIDYLLGAGLIRWAWQTYAWSAGRWHPGAHVQQYRNGVLVAGGDVDLDRAMVDDFGQWTPGGDMPLTPQEIEAIADAVWGRVLDVWALDEKGDAHTIDHVPAAMLLSGANCASWTAADSLTNVPRVPAPGIRKVLLADSNVTVTVDTSDLKAEMRDAVADLGEGGAARVREDL